MSKKSERIKAEKNRSEAADNYLLFLEASDFVPLVPEYFPLNRLFIEQYKSSSLLGELQVPSVVPTGFIGVDYLHANRAICINEIVAFNPSIMSKYLLPKLQPKSSIFASVNTGYVWADGKCVRSIPKKFYWEPGFGPNNQWVELNPTWSNERKKRVVTRDGRELFYGGSHSSHLGTAPALAARYRYAAKSLWQISVSAESGRCSLILPASEAGVKGFYDLREGPYSGSRRSALQHFVKTYSRQNAEGESPVRCHFRGREEFDWFGLKCKILPPEKIADQVHESKLQGAA